jgi:S-DNA-T family DNA segregation ATPase FtsK/SpoIIIE
MSPAKNKKTTASRANGARSAPKKSRPLAAEIAGIVLLFAALFLLVSLIGYDSADPSWAHAGPPGQKVHNIGGPVGAWLADAAFQGFGFVSFLLPFMIAYLGIKAVLIGERQHLLRKAGKFLLALVILGPLLNLLLPKIPWRGTQIQAGGFISDLINGGLTGLLNSTGAVILLVAAAVLFLALSTGLSFKRLFLGLGRLFAFAPREVKIKITDKPKPAKAADSRAAAAAAATEEIEAAGREKKKKKKDRAPLPAGEAEAPPVKESKRPLPTELKAGRIKPPRVEPPKPEPALFPEIEAGYTFPPLTLLDVGTPVEKIDKAELLEKKRLIEEKLREFRIEGEVKEYSPGPVITTYEFYPSPGIKIAQVTNLSEDLSLALRAESVRVQRIPGKSSLGVEIPNNTREIIRLRDILASEEFAASSSKLTFALGKSVHGEVYLTDLTQMPHLLIAGATGTGKSVALNSLIASILYKASPEEVKIVLIDPKQIEFSAYDGIPHLLSPVIKDPKKAGFVLMDAVRRMEERLRILGQHKVRNIFQYNQQIAHELKEKKGRLTDDDRARLKPLPYIVIIIDELAELMMVSGQDVDYSISRLAQLARAVGIHLVLATQRPSIDVITGTIKNNFSSRIAFRVPSKIDSRIILDAGGAEKLLGKGDMLFIPPANPRLLRLHGAYVSNAEIRRLVKFVSEQAEPVYDERIADILDSTSGPDFLEAGERDERYDDAVKLVLNTGQASASYLQRRLKLGYARASRIIDQMEQEGVLGPADGSKPREILVDPKEYLAGLKKPRDGGEAR